ncbi:MAG: hypothetical protein ACTSUE_15375 [Promethearchaeota archaeon]
MPDPEEIPDNLRVCPYCKKEIKTRPYWNHIASDHPDEYENSRTAWYPLYKDYSIAGMDADTILMVMPELFNVSREEIESFLIVESVNEKISSGMSEGDAKKEVAEAFGKDDAHLRAYF